MNMGVMEAGPVISMPGLRSSAGTVGTRHGCAASPAGGLSGSCRSRIARCCVCDRASRKAATRGPKVRCMCAKYTQNSGENSSAAPSTGAKVTPLIVGIRKPPSVQRPPPHRNNHPRPNPHTPTRF